MKGRMVDLVMRCCSKNARKSGVRFLGSGFGPWSSQASRRRIGPGYAIRGLVIGRLRRGELACLDIVFLGATSNDFFFVFLL